MEPVLISPAKFFIGFFPTAIFSLLIPVAGVALFTYIMAKRMAPLVKAAPDNRLDNIPVRVVNLIKVWLLQWKQRWKRIHKSNMQTLRRTWIMCRCCWMWCRYRLPCKRRRNTYMWKPRNKRSKMFNRTRCKSRSLDFNTSRLCRV